MSVSADTSETEKWIVFLGFVDTLWIVAATIKFFGVPVSNLVSVFDEDLSIAKTIQLIPMLIK